MSCVSSLRFWRLACWRPLGPTLHPSSRCRMMMITPRSSLPTHRSAFHPLLSSCQPNRLRSLPSSRWANHALKETVSASNGKSSVIHRFDSPMVIRGGIIGDAFVRAVPAVAAPTAAPADTAGAPAPQPEPDATTTSSYGQPATEPQPPNDRLDRPSRRQPATSYPAIFEKSATWPVAARMRASSARRLARRPDPHHSREHVRRMNQLVHATR